MGMSNGDGVLLACSMLWKFQLPGSAFHHFTASPFHHLTISPFHHFTISPLPD
jgi:hypothetical protein